MATAAYLLRLLVVVRPRQNPAANGREATGHLIQVNEQQRHRVGAFIQLSGVDSCREAKHGVSPER